MKRTLFNLLVILAGGIGLYYAAMATYSAATANVLGLGYFLLTIRLFDLLETVEEAVSTPTKLN